MITIKQDLKFIRDKLRELVEDYNICGLKGGTEIEDMSFEEIIILDNICCDIVPLTVKIGGPEARNDIRFLLKQGIEGVLAPMIETPYAFDNFMNTLQSLSALDHNSFSTIAVNIETITAFENQKKFEESELYPYLTHITVGRTDLSSSLFMEADDPKIYTITQKIVERARSTGKITSVGGKITVDNVESIYLKINPHRINSRHVIVKLLQNSSGEFLQKTILKILQFEIALFRLFTKVHPSKKKIYEKRVQISMNRMNSAKGILSA